MLEMKVGFSLVFSFQVGPPAETLFTTRDPNVYKIILVGTHDRCMSPVVVNTRFTLIIVVKKTSEVSS